MRLAVVPFDDVEFLKDLAGDVEVRSWEGPASDSPLPSWLAETTFYVPRYMGDGESLQVMAQLPSLEICQTLTAGVDNVWQYLPPGVTLCNARGVHDASTAELVVGLIIASLRGIPDFVRAAGQGTWLPGRREALADKRVLLVGYGSVGAAVDARLTPFEVTVTRVARSPRPGSDPPVHGFAELPALLGRAQIVVLTAPLTEQTRGMVDAEFLAALPDGCLVVNAARGQVVVTEDLLSECATGRLSAALDVTDPEPLPAKHPLWQLPNVLISPHVGGNSTAFPPRARRLVADQLGRYARGESLKHVMTHPGEEPAAP